MAIIRRRHFKQTMTDEFVIYSFQIAFLVHYMLNFSFLNRKGSIFMIKERLNKEKLEQLTLEQLITEINRRGLSVTFHAPVYNSQVRFDSEDMTVDSSSNTENSGSEKRTPGIPSRTLGGRARPFTWYVNDNSILIINRIDAGIRDIFPLEELLTLLQRLQETFGTSYFPLANNLQKLHDGNEEPGLGQLINELTDNITKAQAASQLAAILRECGIFEWNGKQRGIEMRLINVPNNVNQLREYLLKVSSS